MAQPAPSSKAIRVADLSNRGETPFSIRPTAEEMAEIAASLELSALRKLSFEGGLGPLGKSDWKLKGRLGATVVQPCVVTLEPVTTRIDVDVGRQFIQDYEEPSELESEMPDDETVEALGAWIDLELIMTEALSIAVPDYPRKDAAELGQMVYTEPGQDPMTDEDAKPFAGLAALKSQMEEPGSDS